MGLRGTLYICIYMDRAGGQGRTEARLTSEGYRGERQERGQLDAADLPLGHEHESTSASVRGESERTESRMRLPGRMLR